MAVLLPGQQRKLVLFNGPRHSGKDTAALRCVKAFQAHHFKMSAPIKAAIKAAFELSDQDVADLEQIKTAPTGTLFFKSYVECQISFSEDWAKPFFGEYVFGNLALRHVMLAMDKDPSQALYVCSDSGFRQEAEPLIDLFGRENVLLVRLIRRGKDFTGDSRTYIDLDKVATVSVSNNRSIEEYGSTIDDVVGSFLAETPSPF